jgi:hypothetical protein
MHQHRDAIKVSLLTALSDTNVGLVFTVVNSELRPGIDLLLRKSWPIGVTYDSAGSTSNQ